MKAKREREIKRIAEQVVMGFMQERQPRPPRQPRKPRHSPEKAAGAIPAQAASEPAPRMKIPPGMLAWASRTAEDDKAAREYGGYPTLAQFMKVDPRKLHPLNKGVVPDDQMMAMDECANAFNEVNAVWAASIMGQVWEQGLAFLGYPYLAMLAQRAEYRVIVETIATECTRKWLVLKAASDDKSKADKLKAIEDEWKRLKVRDHFRNALEVDGFFGRGHLYLDTGASDDLEELKTPIGNGSDAISRQKIGKGQFRGLKVIEPIWCYPINYESRDPLKQDWYKPQSWGVQGKQMHVSRLLPFVGREVPDLLKPAYSFGGLSMTQLVKPTVDNWLKTRKSVNDLITAFSVMILKTNLSTLMQGQGDNLLQRMTLFTQVRDNRGLFLADKNTEDFTNVSAPLSGLDLLQAQAQEHQASVSRIPLVKLLGIQPAGLNASSEGELITFEDMINAYQHKMGDDSLHAILGLTQLSLFGEIDPEITFEWVPLRQLNEKEAAEKRKIDAETAKVEIDAGVLDPQEERERIANDPNTLYPGLDVNDMPEPPEGAGEFGGPGEPNDPDVKPSRSGGGNGKDDFHTEA